MLHEKWKDTFKIQSFISVLLEIIHYSITNLKFGGTRRVNMPHLSCCAYISQHIKFQIGSDILDVTHEFLSQGWHSSYLMPSCEGCVLYISNESLLLILEVRCFVIILETACQNLSSTVVISFSFC